MRRSRSRSCPARQGRATRKPASKPGSPPAPLRPCRRDADAAASLGPASRVKIVRQPGDEGEPGLQEVAPHLLDGEPKGFGGLSVAVVGAADEREDILL